MRKWSQEELDRFKKDLQQLYVVENLSINEIGEKLSITAGAVHKRLQRLNFPSLRHLKKGYNNTNYFHS